MSKLLLMLQLAISNLLKAKREVLCSGHGFKPIKPRMDGLNCYSRFYFEFRLS